MKHASWDGTSVSGAVRYALLMSAFATLAATNQARAADAAADAADANTDTGGALQEVVVTGSLIKRTDFDTPSPVQVISAQEIAQQGYTSVSQVLNSLSANGQGSLSQGFGGAFASGASGVALRGLTVGATLTMIDGERMIAYPLSDDGQRSFVDVSSIPLLAVDRIDVVKDGASAEYGSDAIAGVINVVLKKTYTGFETSAEAGTTNHSDGTTERLAFIGGLGDLASDGYNGYLAVEWRHQDQILDNSRTGQAWNRLNWIPEGGTNSTPGEGSTFNNLGLGNPFPIASGPYLVPASATSYQSAGVKFLSPACPSAASLAADQCTYYNSLYRGQIQPQTGNLNIIGRFTKSLGDNWQGVVTTSWFRSEGEQVGFPQTVSNPGVPIQNPAYGPGFLGVTAPVTLSIPNSNPMNGTGQTLYPVGLLNEFGAFHDEVITNTYRTFLNLTGKEFGWDLSASGGIMYALTQQTYLGLVNFGALQNAFNNGYVLGSGGALAAGVSPNIVSHMSNSLQVADLGAQRALVDLPGGPLSFAVGAGYQHRYLNSTQSPEAESGLYQVINAAYAQGGQTDASAYGELEAPILKGLEVDVAERYDHYNNTGGDTVPKFGAKWSPLATIFGDDNKLVTLRGTYGKGFRAPNPAEYKSAAAAFLIGDFADPQLCPSSNANPALPQFNLNAVQTTPQKGDVAQFCNFPAVFVQGTNPKLQPEHSTNFTWGAIFEPIPQLSLSADFWNIVVENLVVNPTEFSAVPFPPAPVSNVRTGPVTLPVIQQGGGTVNTPIAAGEPIYSLSSYVNAGKIHVDGIDLDFAGHFDVGPFGKVTPSLNWSHEIVWNLSNCYQGACAEVHLAGTHGPSGISGDTGNPKDKGVLSVAWDYGPVNVTWTVNYVGPYSITDPSIGQNTCASAFANALTPLRFGQGVYPGQYCVVKAFTDVNLYASYNVTHNLQVFGSVLNLFNAQPPVDLETYGSGELSYNPSLEQQGAIGMFFDIGVKWKL